MKWILSLLLSLTLASCSLPIDPHATLETVQGGELKVGLVAGQPDIDAQRARLQQLAEALDASLRASTGTTYALMDQLEHGELDIVASLPKNTPFHAAFTQPVGRPTPEQAVPPVWALRAGENAWLLRVNRFLLRQRHGS